MLLVENTSCIGINWFFSWVHTLNLALYNFLALNECICKNARFLRLNKDRFFKFQFSGLYWPVMIQHYWKYGFVGCDIMCEGDVYKLCESKDIFNVLNLQSIMVTTIQGYSTSYHSIRLLKCLVRCSIDVSTTVYHEIDGRGCERNTLYTRWLTWSCTTKHHVSMICCSYELKIV